MNDDCDIAALIFDFDGVIVDSEPLHCRAFQETLADFGLELTAEQYFSQLIGFDDRGAMEFFLRRHGITLETRAMKRLLSRKAAAFDALIRTGDFHALPGVGRFVRQASRRFPLGICSGARGGEIRKMLAGVGLTEFFQVIVAAEDVSVSKPDPAGYFQAARLLGQKTGRNFAPGNCLVIEDAPTVIHTTRAAGFHVLGVATTYPADALTEASHVIPSLAGISLDDVLKNLGQRSQTKPGRRSHAKAQRRKEKK